jgi:hypothetical protein
VEKTRLELSCPACGKTRIVDMERADPFIAALFGAVGQDYLFREGFVCECGKGVLATLQVSALGVPAARRGRGWSGDGIVVYGDVSGV